MVYDRVASTGMNFATWDAKGAATLNDGDVSVVASRACIPSDYGTPEAGRALRG